MIYALFDIELSNWFTKTYGMEELPFIKKGLAHCEKNYQDLKDTIEKCLTNEVRLDIWKRIQKNVQPPGFTTDKIFHILSNE